MQLEERIYSVLVVSASDKFNESLAAFLPESDYSPITFVGSVSAAKRESLERNYDFVLINTPLPDDFGSRFAIDVTTQSSAVALVLARSDTYNDVHTRLMNHGVPVLRKPTSSQMMAQTLDFMCAMRERLRKLQKKAVSVEEKMEEIRLVNRAKWVLIENLRMSEPEAHRYLEKQAMDRCISRKEMAENILRSYG